MKDCEGKEGEAGDLRERPVTSGSSWLGRSKMDDGVHPDRD